MKRPSFQFYPADWLQETGLRACSLAARGLWIDMMCFMHQGNPYGYLTVPLKDGSKDILRPIHAHILARMVGASTEEVEALLAELEGVGVFGCTGEGVIYSRRMVKDEQLRQTRAACGIQSLGNPKVPRRKDGSKDGRKDTFDGSLGGTFGGSPSSSSSLTTSKSSEPATRSDGKKKLSATDVAIALCQQNGWTSKDVALALQNAIAHQAKVMPDAELEQVGEWLVAAWYEHKEQNGQFAGSVKNFFAEAKYAEGPRPEVSDHKVVPPHLRVRRELRGNDEPDAEGASE
jgi:hypothetical protein